MNKHELAEAISQRVPAVNKKTAEEMLNAMTEIITETMRNDGQVTLTGFGTFLAKHRVARVGVNPQKKGEKINIPPITVAKFKAGKALKDSLKSGRTEAPTVVSSGEQQ